MAAIETSNTEVQTLLNESEQLVLRKGREPGPLGWLYARVQLNRPSAVLAALVVLVLVLVLVLSALGSSSSDGNPARGVCIFDVDMTLTCGGDCVSADCENADPIAGATCLDTARTSGYQYGYPLRFNVPGTEAVLAWCAARDFVPAIATHGSRAEVEHVGACALPKMDYVKQLLGIDDSVVCRDVRELMATEQAGQVGGVSRCVYGGSSWGEGGRVEKIRKDNHVRAILRSFRPTTISSDFEVMFFDDGLANQADVLAGNATYALTTQGGHRHQVAVRVTFPNNATALSAGGWGNPNSCGLVAGDLLGLDASPSMGWALATMTP